MTVFQLARVTDVMRELRRDQFLWLHHGNAEGADEQAHDLWYMVGGLVCLHPGHDHRPLQEPYHDARPRHSHLMRNRHIVAETDVLLAAPAEALETPRGGTWYTVRRARRKGSTVLLVLPSGRLVREAGTHPIQGCLF